MDEIDLSKDTKESSWNLNNGETPYFIPSKMGIITYKFHGTRFWLTGLESQNLGKLLLTIDGTTVECDETTYGTNQKLVDNSIAILLYESDVYELDDDKTIALANML